MKNEDSTLGCGGSLPLPGAGPKLTQKNKNYNASIKTNAEAQNLLN